jgi:hypothetical protein
MDCPADQLVRFVLGVPSFKIFESFVDVPGCPPIWMHVPRHTTFFPLHEHMHTYKLTYTLVS